MPVCVKKSLQRIAIPRADVSRDKTREATSEIHGVVRTWIALKEIDGENNDETDTDNDKRNYKTDAITSRES